MTDFTQIKQQTYQQLHQLSKDGDVSNCYHSDAQWWGCHPFNEVQGHTDISAIWRQLRTALPDMERRDGIFISGESKVDNRVSEALTGRILVASMGCYQGTFQQDLCGIPATKGVVTLRSCEVHSIVDGKIAHSYVLFDLLDLMRQANVWPLMPSLGTEGMWQHPATHDGVRLNSSEPAQGDSAFNTVIAMHNALLSFDGKDLNSMQHQQYWTDHFLWYGPAGIGTTRSMSGFRAHHQIPFLVGFPDRQGSGHYVRIGDGDYVVTGGWPSVTGTHLGEWLGMPATGKVIQMRVMDFYHLVDGRIAENWVPIDIIHMLKQMGFDVFARLKHLRGQPALNLPEGYGE